MSYECQLCIYMINKLVRKNSTVLCGERKICVSRRVQGTELVNVRYHDSDSGMIENADTSDDCFLTHGMSVCTTQEFIMTEHVDK